MKNLNKKIEKTAAEQQEDASASRMRVRRNKKSHFYQILQKMLPEDAFKTQPRRMFTFPFCLQQNRT
jgi:hypothetical protein